jgi:nucleoside-diphosphate-sugar epimerase
MRIKDARQTFLGIWIKRLLQGEPILVFGDGKQVRDYNYVDDVVSAMLVAATNPAAYGEIFNLGAEDPMSLKATAEIMCSIRTGASFQIVPFPDELKKIDIGDYYSDYRKIRSRLDWKPVTSFEEGIKKTIEYYADNLNFYLD